VGSEDPRPACRIRPAMEIPMTPTPEQVADCMRVAQLGGNLDRLAAACLDQSSRYEGDGRQRLIDAAAALSWTGRLLAALDDGKAEEDAHAER
jgi:hypothetical protein